MGVERQESSRRTKAMKKAIVRGVAGRSMVICDFGRDDARKAGLRGRRRAGRGEYGDSPCDDHEAGSNGKCLVRVWRSR